MMTPHTTTTATWAVVHFRTMANGSYQWMRGLRRGYWRVLEVHDVTGSTHLGSHNVIRELWASREGIDGVGPRSRYSLGWAEDKAHAIADTHNAQPDAQRQTERGGDD